MNESLLAFAAVMRGATERNLRLQLSRTLWSESSDRRRSQRSSGSEHIHELFAVAILIEVGWDHLLLQFIDDRNQQLHLRFDAVANVVSNSTCHFAFSVSGFIWQFAHS